MLLFMYKHNINNFNMTLTTTFTSPQTKQKQQQEQQNIPALIRRKGDAGKGNFRIKKGCPHLLVHSVIPILVFLCWLPDFIVALKDVSVTIPQAVKRGSNAMLTCNYDMENDTLYSVKWYKGRREFYRYTPKENPAMKVFPSQSGLNVERNLSNQSHIVLLAVPLNISGKFTCEISVEAPSFQTAMVSGEMEVVELPEEQATVTGIQPRYRIGDLVDGNCSIKYSKPAANLTWTINGIVVPPHHIKTYQIEKYEETNMESVMSAVHFMVTTQHFVKGQMRLKCTASIFDIFKEEIESIIEEDRPRIMASGQSYPPDHGYGGHSDGDGYEHNESYLTYFSAPKSSASPSADFVIGTIVKKSVGNIMELMKTSIEYYTAHYPTASFLIHLKSYLAPNNIIDMENSYFTVIEIVPMKAATATLVILLVMALLNANKQKMLTKFLTIKSTQDKQLAFNFIEKSRQIAGKEKENSIAINLWRKTQYRKEMDNKNRNGNCYQDAKDDDCQAKCSQRQQYQHEKHCLAANQNVVNEKVIPNDTYFNTISKKAKNKKTTAIDGQHNMSQAVDFTTLTPTSCATIHLPPYSAFSSSSLRSSTSTLPALSSSSSSSSLSLSSISGHRKPYAHDSFPLCAVDASKSNNAKCMSKDQTLLMTFTGTAANGIVVAAIISTSYSLCTTSSVLAPITASSARALVLESKLLHTSVHFSLAARETNLSPSLSPLQICSRNNYLMAFIGELLLHQC